MEKYVANISQYRYIFVKIYTNAEISFPMTNIFF